MTDQIDQTRRTVLHGLTAGGAAITARQLPGAWTRPVVETVILPAHAQTSEFQLSCSGSPPTGTTIGLGDSVMSTLQVIPPPPLPASATLRLFCGPTSDPESPIPLDANGTATATRTVNSQNLACAGFSLDLRWTFEGQSVVCSWPVAAP